MKDAIIRMIDHPWLFSFAMVCCLVWIGMTYEFLLKLFGRRGLIDPNGGSTVDDAAPPPSKGPDELQDCHDKPTTDERYPDANYYIWPCQQPDATGEPKSKKGKNKKGE